MTTKTVTIIEFKVPLQIDHERHLVRPCLRKRCASNVFTFIDRGSIILYPPHIHAPRFRCACIHISSISISLTDKRMAWITKRRRHAHPQNPPFLNNCKPGTHGSLFRQFPFPQRDFLIFFLITAKPKAEVPTSQSVSRGI